MKKLIATSLCLSLVMSLCSCSGESKETTSNTVSSNVDIIVDDSGTIVEVEDEEWYMYKMYPIEAEYNNPYLRQCINKVIGVDGNNVTTLIEGFEITGEGVDNFGYAIDKEFCELTTYDYATGEQVFLFDLRPYQGYVEDDEGQKDYRVINAIAIDGIYYIAYTFANYTSGGGSIHLLQVDMQTGDIISDTEPEELNRRVSYASAFLGSAVGSNEMAFLTGQYGLSTPPYVSNLKATFYNPVTDEITDSAPGALLNVNGANSISGIRYIGDTHYAVIAHTAIGEPLIVVIDTESDEKVLLDYAEAMSDITDDLSDVEVDGAVNSYTNILAVHGRTFIATLNTETMKFEKVFDTQHCNLNKYYYDNGLGAFYVDDERVLMINGLMTHEIGTLAGVAEFTRLDSNPYEGRQLLTAGALGRYMLPEECQMVYDYNDSQEDVFIIVDDSYEFSSEDYYSNYGTYVENSAAITNQLAIDLMSGDGPDIILDAYEFHELNNEYYLVDLLPYLTDTGVFTDERYYTNVFDKAKDSEGHIYQLPTVIVMTGLTCPVYSEADPIGFTFDEYREFVSNHCNGLDPLSCNSSRIDYFVTLFNSMDDMFIVDGAIDLDNEAFRELAEFAMNAPEDGYNPDYFYEHYSADYYYDYATYFVASEGLGLNYGSEPMLRGLPSYDGRGPQISCINSIGISASCNNVDAAVEFMLYTLSDDVQNMWGMNSVDREVVRNSVYDLVDRINIENEIRQIQEPMERLTTHTYEEADISTDRYSYMVDNASGIVSSDTAISVIMYEEMAPFFAGDKTLDQVIPIIEDRVQTVLNERG